MGTAKTIAFGLAVMALVSWSSSPAFAQRGGRGGGGGGGGRGGGGGGNASHFSGGNDGGSHDGGSSHSGFSVQPNGDNGHSRSGGDPNRSSSVSHESFFRGSPDSSRGDRGDRDSNRNGNFNGILNNRGDRGRDRDNSWSVFSDRVRGDYGRRNRSDLPFRYGWWDNYRNDRWPVFSPFAYSRYRDRPYYWWGYTPVGRLTSWLAFGWDRPRYWSYGPDANIYCQDNYVYYDGERYEPVADYYQQIYDLAHSVPKISEEDAKNMDWAPLGVFAVARDDQQNDDPQRTIQLAVNKEGVISGTFFNAEKKSVHPLSGMVDEHTQRAAWAFADDERPKLVFETSINNLTRDNSTMMVHYGPDQKDTEVWHLVRLEQPESSQQASSDSDQQSESNDLP